MGGLQITSDVHSKDFPGIAFRRLTDKLGIPVPLLPVSFQTIRYLHNFNIKK